MMAKRCRNLSTDDPNQWSRKRLRGSGEISSRSHLCTTTIEEDREYLVGLASQIEEKNSQLKAAQQVVEEERGDLRQQRDLFEARWQLLDDERAAQDILLGIELRRCNHQQDLLFKERQDLKLERENFERQWDLLDAKRDETARDLTRMAADKDALSAQCAALSHQRDTLAAECASLQDQMRAAQDSAHKALQQLQLCDEYNQMAKGFKDRAGLLDHASLRFIERLDSVFLHSVPIPVPVPIPIPMAVHPQADSSSCSAPPQPMDVDSFNKLFATAALQPWENRIGTQSTLHSLALQLRKKTDEVKLGQLHLHNDLNSLCNLTTTAAPAEKETATATATDPRPATATAEEEHACATDQHAHSLESEFKSLLHDCDHLHQLLFKEHHALTTVKDNFQKRWQLLHAHAPAPGDTPAHENATSQS